MRISRYLTAGVLAAGIALASASEASAKPPGAKPSGNSRPSSGRPSGGRPAAAQPQPKQQYRSNYNRDYDRHDSSIGIGIGVYPRYSGYQRGYYSPGYGRTYVQPRVYVEDSEPAPVYVEPDERRAETYLRILLPDPEGSVWVDGLASTTSGESRMFGFPDEGGNRAYVHKVKATFSRNGKMVTEEREVRVTGNTTAVVDFKRPLAPESEAPVTPPEENP